MAPHKFWLKRQLPDLPGLPDVDLPGLPDLPDLPGVPPTPTPATTSSGGAGASVTSQSRASSATSSVTSSSPSSSSESVTPTPSSSSSEDPEPSSTPTPPAEQSDVILIQSSSTSSTPASALPASTLIHSKTVVVEPSASGLPNSVGAAKNSFLDNKVLSGVVFGLCGLVGLIIIIVLIFFITRKTRRNRKLEQEIISWDPDHVQNFNSAANRNEDDGRSIEALEEKGRAPSSLDGHYTYTLPSNNPHAKPNAAPHSDYGVQRPIHVALPNTGNYGGQQTYQANW